VIHEMKGAETCGRGAEYIEVVLASY
jgi:hypothetical protein